MLTPGPQDQFHYSSPASGAPLDDTAGELDE